MKTLYCRRTVIDRHRIIEQPPPPFPWLFLSLACPTVGKRFLVKYHVLLAVDVVSKCWWCDCSSGVVHKRSGNDSGCYDSGFQAKLASNFGGVGGDRGKFRLSMQNGNLLRQMAEGQELCVSLPLSLSFSFSLITAGAGVENIYPPQSNGFQRWCSCRFSGKEQRSRVNCTNDRPRVCWSTSCSSATTKPSKTPTNSTSMNPSPLR